MTVVESHGGVCGVEMVWVYGGDERVDWVAGRTAGRKRREKREKVNAPNSTDDRNDTD